MDAFQTALFSEPSEAVATAVQVTILLPAYNEERAIQTVIVDVREAMEATELTYEILVVDDASTDRTAVRAADCDVRVVRRPVNGGAGAARKTGIREARGAIVVMLDADGSYTAADIPRLLAYFPEYDQVNGARTSEQGTLKWLRIPAKWFIRKLACYLTGVKIPDLNTGMKAFKRSVMLQFLWVIPNGFSCVTTMTLAFLANGYAVQYVPTEYQPRIGRSKFRPVPDTLSYFSTVIRMVMYFNPLKVFLPPALLLMGGGAVRALAGVAAGQGLCEVDLIVGLTGFLTAMLGLLADIIVAHHRR